VFLSETLGICGNGAGPTSACRQLYQQRSTSKAAGRLLLREIKKGKITGVLQDAAYQSRSIDLWKSRDVFEGKSTGGRSPDDPAKIDLSEKWSREPDCWRSWRHEVNSCRRHLLEQFLESWLFIEKGFMKKNAIMIASIMFVAGCATNARYSSNYQNDPSLSAQYDPASGGYPSAISGAASYDHANNTSVNDFHADSSVRGGSNEARGWAQRDFLPSEGTPHPMNPAVQADSSIRGGSNAARQSDWYREGNSSDLNSSSDSRIKADSSIRGGSNEARYGHSFQSSNDAQGVVNPDEDMIDKSTSFDYYVLVPTEPSIASDDSLLSSPNWNPSDDLLPDGVQTQPSDVNNPKPNNDASVGGAATSESGSASSKSTLDDISAPSEDVPAEPDNPDSLSSPGSKKDDLNASSQLERDISGEYNLDDQVDDSKLNSSTAVGGPGSTETGVATSNESDYDSTVRDISKDSSDLFRNNRAQGVGSAATGEFGVANSGSLATEKMSDGRLAEQVKSVLTREESGTSGITQREIARNVQVTSHDGTVVLKGTVPSQKAKDMLEVRAREISGVRKVDNQLMVTPEANPSVRDFNIGRDLEDSTDQIHDIAR
jgi:osmotically-inducible protein OsmY